MVFFLQARIFSRNSSAADWRAVFVGPVAENGFQRRVKTDELDQLSVAFGRVGATLQDDSARLDAGIFKPRFGVALQNRVDAEVRQNPFLQGKAVFHVQPTGRNKEAEPPVLFQKVRGRRPEITVQIGASAKFQPRPETGAKLLQILLGLHRLDSRLPALRNQFLPDIRRIADDRVELRKINWPWLAFATQALGQKAKRFLFCHVIRDFEEIVAADARVILLVADVAGGEVQGGEMRGKKGDVRAVNLRQPVLMRDGSAFETLVLFQPGLAMVGANQKAA